MNYIPGQTYEFDVVKTARPDEDFFRLTGRGGGGPEMRLTKLKFQRAEPLPDTIVCRVRYIDNNVPMLGHYLPQYVHRFYGTGAWQGREFDFTVRDTRPDDNTFVTVEDNYGIRFKLREQASMLVPGQRVRCRFKRLTADHYVIERTDSEMRLPFISLDELLEKVGVDRRLAHVWLQSAPVAACMGDIIQEMRGGNATWVLTALQETSRNLSEWFVATDIRRHGARLHLLFETVRNIGLYLLEGSRFLKNLSERQRETVQRQLTGIVEGLDPCRKALEVLTEGCEVQFVENLMQKLGQSGYLYHPGRQLSMLMLILRTVPELIDRYLGRIFETIMGWNLHTWTAEPFRSAFVNQFEIYIRQAGHEIDRLPQAETQADNDRLEKIITALALRTLIGGKNEKDPDYRRNRCLFFRYNSLLRPAGSDELLDKSLLALMGQPLPLDYVYDNIKQPLMLATRAMVPAPAELRRLRERHTLVCGPVKITVSADGISISRTDEDSDSRVIPTSMMPWPLMSPQVCLNNVSALNGSNIRQIDAHRRLWADIENSLFENRIQSAVGTERIVVKADVGDYVYITIEPNEVSGGDDPVWRCNIVDPAYTEGSGYIKRSEIVGYRLSQTDLDRNRILLYNAFIDPKGTPRVFNATVESVNPDGTYNFSLLEEADSHADDVLRYDEYYHAVIANDNGYEYSCITETGYGMYLQRDDKTQVYRRGDVVVIQPINLHSAAHRLARIQGYAEENTRVDKIGAFETLLVSLGLQPFDDDCDGDTEFCDEDEDLTHEEVAEIVRIFRFKALACKEIITAYDYLLYARLLSLAIGDHDMARRLNAHASMLRLHQFYARNSRIDADELEQFRPLIAGYPQLEIIFHRLEIVSWLGKTEMNNELWETINHSRNNLEDTLARLVLSYNMLPGGEVVDASVAKGLKSRIAALLGVNFERTNLKAYGRENQFVEFKSSIVYPARRNKNEKDEADPERQQHVILRIIASFLNSDGGTLYIGVNDQTRCEAGLFEDFEYYKNRKGRIGNHYYEIKTADNMCVFLENLVRATWGNLDAGKVQISVDEDASKDVIIVAVSQSLKPMKLDGRIYVRRSSSSVVLTEDEAEDFIRERDELARRRHEDEYTAAEPAAVTPEETADSEPAPVRPAPAAETVHEASAPVTEHRLQTSRWRPNVLHNYQDGFVTPVAYLYLLNDDTMLLNRDDQYRDTEPDCRLAMVLTDEEVRQGYLLMLFEEQRVLKVPLTEIMEKNENRPISYYHEVSLIFASIVMPDNGLMTVLSDTRGNLWRRITPVREIESAHLTSTPARITETAGTDETVVAEIVSAAAMPGLRQSFKSNLNNRQIGVTLHCGRDSERAGECLENEIARCTL